MKCTFRRSIRGLLFGSILFLLPWLVNASPRPSIPESNKVIISRIISIAAHESIFGTTLNVLGNGKIPAYVTKTLDSPPKIAVDILCPAESLETINVAVKSPELEGLRVGHHPQKIRMVLDVNGVDIPPFAIASVDNEMTIFLSSEETNRLKEDEFNDAQLLGTDKDIATLDRTDEIKADENQTHESSLKEGLDLTRREMLRVFEKFQVK